MNLSDQSDFESHDSGFANSKSIPLSKLRDFCYLDLWTVAYLQFYILVLFHVALKSFLFQFMGLFLGFSSLERRNYHIFRSLIIIWGDFLNA